MIKSSLLPKRFTCKDCGKEFVVTGEEQEFYRSKKLHLPKRCAGCRAQRKNMARVEKNHGESHE